jgi:glycerol-3-phosphate acyltransferase PlsY
LVSIADILKGLLPVFLAIQLDLSIIWQMASGIAAIIGHDFPVFAQFWGGKGLATTIGVFLGLFPIFSLIGAVVYGLIYLFFHNSDLSAGISMGTLALLVYLSDAPIVAVGFIVVVLLFIPLKKWLDKSRLIKIQKDKQYF